MKRGLLTVLASCFMMVPMMAQEQTDVPEPLRPVAAAYTIEFGSASMADTYLSPVTYRGWNAALGYERMQAMKFNPQQWIMQYDFHLSTSRGTNHADNARTWMIDFSALWGMMHRWRLPYSLTVAAGGSTGIDAGVLYNARNSNNPASAKAAWTVNITGFISWDTRLGRLPVTLRYQPTVPLAGIFFSPEYDELYYEIYLGNHDGLVHFASPFNRFSMTNLVTADLRFGSTNLRLGYRGTILSSEVNHLTTNVFTHSFVIGVSGEWLSVPTRGKLSTDSRIISAYY